MRRDDFKWLSLHVGRARGITRRYFVTNGFDGALTMLGLMVGFHSSGNVNLPVAILACLSAAVALCMCGLSSAYLSETAERKKGLRDLEQALLLGLSKSDYGKASHFVPVLVAMVNGAVSIGNFVDYHRTCLACRAWYAASLFPLFACYFRCTFYNLHAGCYVRAA